MTAQAPRPADIPWRFSLRGLLLITAAIACLVWLYTQNWRLDELIFIALWIACVGVGIACLRRGRWSVIVALSAAAIVPVSGFLSYHLYLYYFRRMVVQTEAFYPWTLQVTAYGAAISAALVVTVFAIYHRQSRQVRKWIDVGTTATVVVAAVAYVGVGIHRHHRSWHPILVIPVGGIDHSRPAPPSLALTSDGSLLAIVYPSTDGKTRPLLIWDVKLKESRFRHELPDQVVQTLCFSPDGQQLAIVHPQGVAVYETATGNLVHAIDGLVTANPWVERTSCFSPDGKSFVLCRYDGNEYNALVWETESWTLAHKHVVPNVAQPHVAGDDLVLLTFTPGVYTDLAVVDLETLVPVHPQRQGNVYRPLLSRDGSRAAFGTSVVEFTSGDVNELSGPVYCLANAGRRYVTRRCDMKGHGMERLPDWRLGLPIIRHWWRTRHYMAQVVLVDIASQEEITSSPNYLNQYLLGICASDDGTVVVGTYQPDGMLRVWRVPD